MNPHRLRAYFYLTIVAIIWGIAGPVIKFTLGQFSPFVFLAYRFFLTSLVLLPILIIKRERLPRKPKDLRLLLLASIFSSTINLGLLFYGIKFTSVLDQSIISATAPVLIIIACAIFLKEHITKREIIGTTVALLGSFVIIIQPFLENLGSYKTNMFGNFLILLANFAWVACIILSKIGLKEKISPIMITASSFFIGFITILPLAIIEAGSFQKLAINVFSANIPGHLGVIYMAIISGALAYFLYQSGQKSIEASEATLFSYLQPIFSTPLAVLWLKEKVTFPFIIGAIIVAIGLFIAEIKKKRYN